MCRAIREFGWGVEDGQEGRHAPCSPGWKGSRVKARQRLVFLVGC